VETTTQLETIKVKGGEAIDRVKQFIHEGNVRRIVIKQDERTIVEFPLTLGVVGVVLAPTLAAIGAIAALLTDCTIEVERLDPAPSALTEGEEEERTAETTMLFDA
jgi:hypothetical protein